MLVHRIAAIAAVSLVACHDRELTRSGPVDANPAVAGSAPSRAREVGSLPQVVLTPVVSGLVGPTDLVTRPDGTLVVIDQPGQVYAIEDGALTRLADLGARVVPLSRDYDERGLLGIAYSPHDATRVYLYYSTRLPAGATKNYDHANVLSEMRVRDDGRIDAAHERILLQVEWPAPNHDGGTIAFGSDGMLYVAMGDGGLAGDIGLGHPPISGRTGCAIRTRSRSTRRPVGCSWATWGRICWKR